MAAKVVEKAAAVISRDLLWKLHFEAAQLVWAEAAVRSTAAGAEAQRAWASLQKVEEAGHGSTEDATASTGDDATSEVRSESPAVPDTQGQTKRKTHATRKYARSSAQALSVG